MNKCIICALIALYIGVNGYSREETDSVHMIEIRLLEVFDKMYTTSDEILQERWCDSAFSLLSSVINSKDHFLYPFDTLKRMGKITSEDENIRVFTWNIPEDFGTSRYYGLIARYDKKNKDVLCFPLKSLHEDVENETLRIWDTEHWPGALYYDIIDFRVEGKTSYVLLGYHLNDILTNKKYIEILGFDEIGLPYFGDHRILIEGKKQTRMVFTYSEKTTMSLSYHPRLKMIVFDHLSPDRPSLIDQYQYYGPDMSFDALKWEDGYWVYQKDIEITN